MKRLYWFYVIVTSIMNYDINKESYARMKLTKYYKPTDVIVLKPKYYGRE